MTGAERCALAELVHRYAAGVDDRRFDDVAALFAQDAELVLPDPPRALDPVTRHDGHPAIRAALAAVLAVERTEHAIVGEVYTQEGPDRARGRITCLAHHFSRRDRQASVLVWHLRYEDDYVRSGQEWLFSRRALTIGRDRNPAGGPAAAGLTRHTENSDVERRARAALDRVVHRTVRLHRRRR